MYSYRIIKINIVKGLPSHHDNLIIRKHTKEAKSSVK